MVCRGSELVGGVGWGWVGERGGQAGWQEKEGAGMGWGQKPTAPGIPRRSPIQVLTRPDPA